MSDTLEQGTPSLERVRYLLSRLISQYFESEKLLDPEQRINLPYESFLSWLGSLEPATDLPWIADENLPLDERQYLQSVLNEPWTRLELEMTYIDGQYAHRKIPPEAVPEMILVDVLIKFPGIEQHVHARTHIVTGQDPNTHTFCDGNLYLTVLHGAQILADKLARQGFVQLRQNVLDATPSVELPEQKLLLPKAEVPELDFPPGALP